VVQGARHRDQDGVVGGRAVPVRGRLHAGEVGADHGQPPVRPGPLVQRAGGRPWRPETAARAHGLAQQMPGLRGVAQRPLPGRERVAGEAGWGGGGPGERHLRRAGSSIDQLGQHREPADLVGERVVQHDHQGEAASGRTGDHYR
jgi:hypothetical protein